MYVWCRAAHRRFWQVEERYVDTLGAIEYWICTLCRRRWQVILPPVKSPQHAQRPLV